MEPKSSFRRSADRISGRLDAVDFPARNRLGAVRSPTRLGPIPGFDEPSRLRPEKTGKPGSKRRILFIGEAVSLAHIGRPAMLAGWARAAGYDVFFACGPTYDNVVRAEGLEPIPLKTISPKTFYARLAKGKFFYTTQEIEEYVRAELKLYARLRPDLVVGDFRLSLSVSTALAGVPFLPLVNAHWSPGIDCKLPPPNAAPFKFLPHGLREAFFACLRPVAFRVFAAPLNRVRKRVGLPTLNDFRRHYTAGTWCAYLDLPELFPMDAPPEGHFFLGPLAWRPRNLPQPRLGELGRKRPLAYVTMGSTGDARTLPNILRALLELGFDIALSGVDDTHFDVLRRQLPELSGRCFHAALFDPRRVLRRARVTVCHGGSGTVQQSLQAGVPVLCLTVNPDQLLVSRAVTQKGAGAVLTADRVTVKRMRAALAPFLVHGGYAESARRLARAFNRRDVRREWLNFLARAVPQKVQAAAE